MAKKNLIGICACISLLVMGAQAAVPTLSFDDTERGLGEQLQAVQQGGGGDSVEHKSFWDSLDSSKGKVGEHEPRTVMAKDFDDFLEKKMEEKRTISSKESEESTVDPNSISSLDEPKDDKTDDSESKDEAAEKTDGTKDAESAENKEEDGKKTESSENKEESEAGEQSEVKEEGNSEDASSENKDEEPKGEADNDSNAEDTSESEPTLTEEESDSSESAEAEASVSEEKSNAEETAAE